MLQREGNLLDHVKAGIIVQQVNAQGVMGSGIAKSIRDKWPVVWEEYSRVVRQSTIDMGAGYMGMIIPVEVEKNLWVVNIVGQQFYGREPGKRPGGRYTSYDALDLGFQRLGAFALENMIVEDGHYTGYPQIHFPLIGCGLGGGKWSVVQALIKDRLPGFHKFLWTLPGTKVPA